MTIDNPNETWAEWETRLAANRKAAIEAETDPVRKAELQQADIMWRWSGDLVNAMRSGLTANTQQEV